MNTPERRKPIDPAALREGLSAEQRHTVDTLEQFGWQLRFVRRPIFRDAVPVLYDRSGQKYVVVQADGTLDESQTLKIRP
ncbi:MULTISPECIES: hypothetical protein [Stenotrophomonas]|jgi:hypothetical protein|uniref:DUF4224 domain-containing protein n=1 Tax=Stenotrophomonas aracearum TaxID=3003272 RepID=A0ABY9YCQ6_9GAMM|nr:MULTISPECIES: hypothetical protein [unclassified Stenotrophomonas]WNH48664.1 hypothetical protein PDM28_18715 [Stenotrophomonas sp. A5588]